MFLFVSQEVEVERESETSSPVGHIEHMLDDLQITQVS